MPARLHAGNLNRWQQLDAGDEGEGPWRHSGRGWLEVSRSRRPADKRPSCSLLAERQYPEAAATRYSVSAVIRIRIACGIRYRRLSINAIVMGARFMKRVLIAL